MWLEYWSSAWTCLWTRPWLLPSTFYHINYLLIILTFNKMQSWDIGNPAKSTQYLSWYSALVYCHLMQKFPLQVVFSWFLTKDTPNLLHIFLEMITSLFQHSTHTTCLQSKAMCGKYVWFKKCPFWSYHYYYHY